MSYRETLKQARNDESLKSDLNIDDIVTDVDHLLATTLHSSLFYTRFANFFPISLGFDKDFDLIHWSYVFSLSFRQFIFRMNFYPILNAIFVSQELNYASQS